MGLTSEPMTGAPEMTVIRGSCKGEEGARKVELGMGDLRVHLLEIIRQGSVREVARHTVDRDHT